MNLEKLQKYLWTIDNLEAEIEFSDNGELWKITLGGETEIAVARSEHPTKLLALTEAKRNVEVMIQGELYREHFKKEYGIV